MSRQVFTEFEIDCFRVHLEHELQNTQGLIRLSEHPNWIVRLSALKALSSNFWRSGILDRMFQMLNDNSWVIRLAVMVVLCREAVQADSPISRVIERKIAELVLKSEESIFKAFGCYYQFLFDKAEGPNTLNILEHDTSQLSKSVLQLILNRHRDSGLGFLELRKIDSLCYLILKRGPLADYQVKLALSGFEQLTEIERSELILSAIQRFSN